MPDRGTVLKLGQNESIIQLYLGGSTNYQGYKIMTLQCKLIVDFFAY